MAQCRRQRNESTGRDTSYYAGAIVPIVRWVGVKGAKKSGGTISICAGL
jgi:hypothetical protein